MEARLLLKVFDSVYLFSLTAWVGSILFFSFGVAPIIFKVLDPSSAARFVRALFPRYYAWGVISSGLALPAFLAVPLSFPEMRGYHVMGISFLIIAAIMIFMYCGNSLTPAINAARDAGPEHEALFAKLHKRSVMLNVVALILGIVLLVLFATRRPPQSEGIIEKTPQERYQYESEFQSTFLESIEKGKSTPKPVPPGTRFPFDDEARKETEEFAKKYRAKEARRLGKSPDDPLTLPPSQPAAK